MSTRDQTLAYYDRHATRYDQRTGFAPNTGQAYNLARHYAPFLEDALPETGRALEIGCGTGFYTNWLAERGVSVVGMDLSPRMIEQAKLRCPDDVALFVGNCEDPASVLDPERVRDGFDVIVGVNTFSYYPNKKAALRNYHELLADGGRLVLLDIHGNAYTQQIAYLTNFRGARQFSDNIRESTRPILSSLLRECGFQVERFERLTFMPNAVNRLGVTLIAPFDWILSRVPLAQEFAIRIAVVATKA
jgi:SAM-dependent methyltransferase